tara:strand:- start:1375 stop:1608 length:234 start_codon:yes stop_codon:yes gene_type:complete
MSRFLSVFKDNNDWNEKTIIGAISFAMMVITAVVDVTTGVWGMQLEVQEFIYNSFLIITLGCFSISGIEKWAPSKTD